MQSEQALTQTQDPVSADLDGPADELTPEQVVALKGAIAELGNEIRIIDGLLGDAKNNGGREVDGDWVPYEALGPWITKVMAAKRYKERQGKKLRLRLTYHYEKRQEEKSRRAQEYREGKQYRPRYVVIDDAYAAMRILADTFRAACALVDDDSDENWATLTDLVETGRQHGLDALAINQAGAT